MLPLFSGRRSRGGGGLREAPPACLGLCSCNSKAYRTHSCVSSPPGDRTLLILLVIPCSQAAHWQRGWSPLGAPPSLRCRLAALNRVNATGSHCEHSPSLPLLFSLFRSLSPSLNSSWAASTAPSQNTAPHYPCPPLVGGAVSRAHVTRDRVDGALVERLRVRVTLTLTPPSRLFRIAERIALPPPSDCPVGCAFEAGGWRNAFVSGGAI